MGQLPNSVIMAMVDNDAIHTQEVLQKIHLNSNILTYRKWPSV